MNTYKCVLCGNEFGSKVLTKYICDQCQDKLKLVKNLEKVDIAVRKLNKRKRIVEMYVDQEDVSQYAELVKTNILNDVDSFSSLPEVLVAIQLLRQGVRYETQKSIRECRVDFYIPDYQWIIEVDGSLYHTDEDRTFVRDRQIMAHLGEAWEIVHISAEDVPDATWDLKGAIPYIISERNERYGFRNTYFDSPLLLEYTDFLTEMRKGRGRDRHVG